MTTTTHDDFFELQLPDGLIHKRRGTRWRNPSGAPVRLELQYDEARFREHPNGRGVVLEHPAIYLTTTPDGVLTVTEVRGRRDYLPKVTIPPGGEIVLPSDFDQAIQQEQCIDCPSKAFDCRDRSHQRRVVGGMGPQLVRAAGATPLHPAIDPALAARAPAPAHDVGGQDARLLARARAGAR